MASFVLVPGAGGMAWYWHRVVPLIRAAGHEPIGIDLPGDDRHAGLAAYADIVIRAIAERSDVILVAQVRRNSMWERTFCTTCRRTCCAPARNNHARKLRPFSASLVASSAGPKFPFMFLRGETTVFSRSNFNGVSRVKGSERRWRKFPAATSSRCRMRKG